MGTVTVTGTHISDFNSVNARKTGASQWSPVEICQMPIKTPLPSAPSINSITSPSDSTGILKIDIFLPTTNNNGTPLATAEITKLQLYHSLSSPVTKSDSCVIFGGPQDDLLWTPGDLDTHYIAVSVVDSHGNESALSEEASGAATATVPQEESGLLGHRLDKASDFYDNNPAEGSIAWENVILYWGDNKYAISDGDSDKAYIWFDESVNQSSPYTFTSQDTAPDITSNDVLVAYNDKGTCRLMVYSPTAILSYLRAGTITSQSIELALAAGEGDVEIRAGIASGEFNNASANSGFILGVDDTDDTAKFYFGETGKHISWDGSDLEVKGGIIRASSFQTAASPNDRLEINTTEYVNELVMFEGTDRRTHLRNASIWLRDVMSGKTGTATFYAGSGATLDLSYDSDTTSLILQASATPSITFSGNTDSELEGSSAANPLVMANVALKKLTSAPGSPKDGLLVYADGTTWNPGSGEGAYIYYNSAWNYLG